MYTENEHQIQDPIFNKIGDISKLVLVFFQFVHLKFQEVGKVNPPQVTIFKN